MQSFITSVSFAIVVASCLMYLITSIYAHVVQVDIIEVDPPAKEDEPDPGWCRVELPNGSVVYGWVREVGLADVGAIEISREPGEFGYYIDWYPMPRVLCISRTSEAIVIDNWNCLRSTRPGAIVEAEEEQLAKSIADNKAADELLAAQKKKAADECPVTKKPSGFPPAAEANEQSDDHEKPF